MPGPSLQAHRSCGTDLVLILGTLESQWKFWNSELDKTCFSKFTGGYGGSLWVARWHAEACRSWWLILREGNTFKKSFGGRMGSTWWQGGSRERELERHLLKWRERVMVWVFQGIGTFCLRLGSSKTQVEMGPLIPASVWVVVTSLGQDSLGFV